MHYAFIACLWHLHLNLDWSFIPLFSWHVATTAFQTDMASILTQIGANSLRYWHSIDFMIESAVSSITCFSISFVQRGWLLLRQRLSNSMHWSFIPRFYHIRWLQVDTIKSGNFNGIWITLRFGMISECFLIVSLIPLLCMRGMGRHIQHSWGVLCCS